MNWLDYMWRKSCMQYSVKVTICYSFSNKQWSPISVAFQVIIESSMCIQPLKTVPQYNYFVSPKVQKGTASSYFSYILNIVCCVFIQDDDRCTLTKITQVATRNQIYPGIESVTIHLNCCTGDLFIWMYD